MPEIPSSEEKNEFLLSCRYGELDEVNGFVDRYGGDVVRDIRDEHGNTAFHMVSGNGHEDVLDYLLEHVPKDTLSHLLSSPNDALSTPLHWAAVNAHLGIAQKLVRNPHGAGVSLIDAKNSAGRTPLGEAELANWEEGAKWFVEVMNLDEAPVATEGEDVGDEGGGVEGREIEVEIQDAEGQVAKMSISKRELDQGGHTSGQP